MEKILEIRMAHREVPVGMALDGLPRLEIDTDIRRMDGNSRMRSMGSSIIGRLLTRRSLQDINVFGGIGM